MNQSLVLAADGQSRWRIVAAADAPTPVRTAATELQTTLREMTGAALPIVDDTDAAPGHALLVGPSRALARVAPDLATAALGPEEYVLRTVGNALVIVGGAPRGTLYGVHALLRDHLGCRWFAPDCTVIPRRPRLVLPPLDERAAPAYEYRNFILDDVANHPAWCARNGFNGFNSGADAAHGGHRAHWQYGHSLHALLPVEQHFRDHPEYFDLTSRRKTVRDDHVNLCYTNRAAAGIVADNLKRVIEQALATEQRDPAQPAPEVFYLAQNDGGAPCTCAACRRLAVAEGALSAPLIAFCNRVTDDVARAFPDRLLMTIAYRFSRRPPRTLPAHPRLIVQLCGIECCQSHPHATCEEPDSARYRDDLAGWRRVAGRLWVWDYMPRLWHPFLVGPGFDSLADNLRWYHEQGVRGIFQQTGGTRDFHWLNAYLMCAQMRDPFGDWAARRDEFMAAYYGAAAAPLRAFQAAVQNSVVAGRHHLHYKEGAVKAFLSADVLTAGDRLFAAAADAVHDDPVRAPRVQDERMHFLATKLQHACRHSVLHGCAVASGRYRFARSPALRAEVAEFAAWKRTHVPATPRRGGCTLHVESDVITLDNGEVALEFLPRLAGRLVGVRLKAAGHNFLHAALGPGGAFNFNNGYREEWLAAPRAYEQESVSSWSSTTGRSAGAAEASAEVTIAGETARYAHVFETGGLFMHPMQWERWTRLTAHGGEFHIESQVVNRGVDRERAAVGTCLPLFLGLLDDVTITVPGRGWRRRTLPRAWRPTPAGGTITLTPADTAGGIVLANARAGLALRWRPVGEVVRRVRLECAATDARIGICLITAPVMLHPGAGRRFCQFVEVRAH